MFNSTIDLTADLGATLIRKDGSHRDINLSTTHIDWQTAERKLKEPMTFWRRVWTELRSKNVIPLAMTLAAFLHAMKTGDLTAPTMALVTTAGVNYLAADFISGGSAHISAFNFHDCGTGTTAAAIGDTALQTAAGTSRVSGTQSNPASGQYKTVATISYTSSLAITEFGLFSASTSGTLWDRRTFSAVNVANGDSIAFSYTLTTTAGGA